MLLASSDYPAAWERADELGDRVAEEFWRRFSPLGLGRDYPHVSENAERMLGVGRPAAALMLLGLYGIRDGEENDPSLVTLVVEALERLLDPGPENGIRDLRQHEFDRIFVYLEGHRETVGEQTLGRLEWSYLPALGMEPRVPTLEAALAKDPAFFVEVISAIYRARSEDEVEKSPEQRQMSQNAYRLLSSWREVPGLDPKSSEIDGKVLQAWVDEARERLRAADRLGSGEVQIGRMLAAAPPTEDGIKPPPPVRDLLENAHSERIEEGLRMEMHNSRGVTSRDPEAGGEPERALVRTYEDAAQQVRTKWPRTASILRGLAKSYEAQAHSHDDRAERLRKGLER